MYLWGHYLVDTHNLVTKLQQLVCVLCACSNMALTFLLTLVCTQFCQRTIKRYLGCHLKESVVNVYFHIKCKQAFAVILTRKKRGRTKDFLVELSPSSVRVTEILSNCYEHPLSDKTGICFCPDHHYSCWMSLCKIPLVGHKIVNQNLLHLVLCIHVCNVKSAQKNPMCYGSHIFHKCRNYKNTLTFGSLSQQINICFQSDLVECSFRGQVLNI